MEKPEFYDEVEINDNLRPKKIKPGYYPVKILNAVEEISKSGNPMLIFRLDIAEGDYKDFYQKKYDNKKDDKNTNQFKNWGCFMRIMLDNKKYSVEKRKIIANKLKSSIVAMEASIPNFKWDWEDKNILDKLKGKVVAASFGMEEFTTLDGSTKGVVKVRNFFPLDILKRDNLKVPKVKLLNGSYINYAEYIEDLKMQKENEEKNDGFITVEDTDDLPF